MTANKIRCSVTCQFHAKYTYNTIKVKVGHDIDKWRMKLLSGCPLTRSRVKILQQQSKQFQNYRCFNALERRFPWGDQKGEQFLKKSLFLKESQWIDMEIICFVADFFLSLLEVTTERIKGPFIHCQQCTIRAKLNHSYKEKK